MIIFYNKKTGKIVGTISGRIHPPQHLKMWAGNKKETDRLIVNWKPVKTEKGVDYEPVTQKELFKKLDKRQADIYKYEVDIKTKELKLPKNSNKS